METLIETINAVKLGFDTLSTLRSLVVSVAADLKSAKSSDSLGEKLKEALDLIQIAEAEKAQAFGYLLCRSHFPPVPMLEVGFRRPESESDLMHLSATVTGAIARGVTSVPVSIPVHECPKCFRVDAFPKGYYRTAPLPSTVATITFVDLTSDVQNDRAPTTIMLASSDAPEDSPGA